MVACHNNHSLFRRHGSSSGAAYLPAGVPRACYSRTYLASRRHGGIDAGPLGACSPPTPCAKLADVAGTRIILRWGGAASVRLNEMAACSTASAKRTLAAEKETRNSGFLLPRLSSPRTTCLPILKDMPASAASGCRTAFICTYNMASRRGSQAKGEKLGKAAKKAGKAKKAKANSTIFAHSPHHRASPRVYLRRRCIFGLVTKSKLHTTCCLHRTVLVLRMLPFTPASSATHTPHTHTPPPFLHSAPVLEACWKRYVRLPPRLSARCTVCFRAKSLPAALPLQTAALTQRWQCEGFAAWRCRRLRLLRLPALLLRPAK